MRFDRRISRRSFLAAAGVSAAALALTACGGSSSTAASTAASTGASSAAGTAAGGTLNIMLETEVQSLDPQIATDGTSFEVIADYTDGLMQMDADGAAVPALAETYDISEDGKTYTFHLRDAKWSNGDAVTAADFVFGWQRAVDPANASEYSYMLSDIGQVVNAAEIIAQAGLPLVSSPSSLKYSASGSQDGSTLSSWGNSRVTFSTAPLLEEATTISKPNRRGLS